MTRDAVIFGIAGTMFGLLAGWIIGSQHARPIPGAVPAPPAAAAAPAQLPAPTLDLKRVSALEAEAKARPSDAAVRAQLGNLYFDAERFDLAISWYEASLALNPGDINVSTDLAVCYYYTNDADKALRQIDKSLAIDAKHAKTILNQGIIRAFGKQDLDGAQKSWERVLEVAPDSPEAVRARQGLDGLRSAHTPGAAPSGAAGAGS